MLKVMNKNSQNYECGYAGTNYSFPPKKDVGIPELAARHIFGWGNDGDKHKAIVRSGRIADDNGYAWLNNFEITEDLGDESPASFETPKKGGKKK